MPSPSVRIRQILGPSVRRWRKRFDNPEVKAARLLVERIRTDPPDVVHFGASESLFVSAQDSDQRTLPQMMSDELAPLSFYSVAGPGYPPALFSAYLDLLAARPSRPVIVIGLAVRFGLPAWARHPMYGYQRSTEAVRRINPRWPTWRIRAAIPLPTEAEMAIHDQLPYPSLAGELTVGDYRRPLKDPAAAGLDDAAALALLYAYHHGGVLAPDNPWLDSVRSLGKSLQEKGFPVVAYHLPVPIEQGEEIYGAAFRDLAISNLATIDTAFHEGFGPIDITQTGPLLSTSEFIDPADATEHVNQSGRARMCDLIVSAVRTQLGERSDVDRS